MKNGVAEWQRGHCAEEAQEQAFRDKLAKDAGAPGAEVES
jgi:hypothetical protein